MIECYDHARTDVQCGWPGQCDGGGFIKSAAEILVINVFKISGLLLVYLGHAALDSRLEQGLDHFAPGGTSGKVADAIHVGETDNDQFKSVKTLVGFDHQLLGHLGVAAGFVRRTVKILIEGAVSLQPAAIGSHVTDLHEPLDSREPHRLSDVDGSHDIDL